jgi:hypothetical protein
MRHTIALCFSAACLLAAATPSWASASFPDKVKAMGMDRPACSDCHVAPTPPRAEAKGGKFKGMGAWLVQQKHARKADKVDIAWLKDYKQ